MGNSINEASVQLLTHLTRAGGLGVSPERLVLVGQSIGCAVAVEMATRGFGRKLVLLSPFSSLQDAAAAVYPIVAPALNLLPFMLFDKFDNSAKAGALGIPTLIVHGTE